MKEKVGVVLVNWNGLEDSCDCLSSLFKLNEGCELSVAVVDNSSSENPINGFRKLLKNSGFFEKKFQFKTESFRRVNCINYFRMDSNFCCDFFLIRNEANYGFAAANNIGYSILSQTCKPDYFWFLNNDTIVSPDCISILLNKMQRNPQIGICGTTLLFHSHPDIVQAYGGVEYSFVTGRGHHIGGGTVYNANVKENELERRLTYVSGASMFVSRAFLSDIGPMCEDYFLYNEEVDWAWRARGKFKLGVATSALVWHKEGASIGTESVQRPASVLSDFFQTRNKLRFARKYVPWFLPTIWLSLFIRTLKRLRAGHKQNAKIMFLVLFGKREPDKEWFNKSRVNSDAD